MTRRRWLARGVVSVSGVGRGLAFSGAVAVVVAVTLGIGVPPVGVAAAEEASGEPRLAPPPAIHASIDTTSVPVGAPLDLTIEVGPSPGWLVDPPTKELDLDPFRVRSVERLERADGSAWRLRLVPLSPGELEIPPVGLVAHGPDGSVDSVATAPVPLTVTSNLSEEEGSSAPSGAMGESAPDNAPTPPGAAGTPGSQSAPGPPGAAGPDSAGSAPLERSAYKPALEAPRDWIPLLVAAASLALAAVLGWWILRKLRVRRRPEDEATPAVPRKPARPAWDVANESLDRILAAAYPEHGELDRQYVAVTEVLRRYLEDRYGVPALESTTEELRLRFRASAVRPEIQTRILALLREADFVKFAKARPEVSDARALEPVARRIVADTTPGASMEAAA